MPNTTRTGNSVRRLWPALLVALPLILLAAAGLLGTDARPVTIELALPTGNDAIFRGDDSAFYMETASGRESPWEGGMFGFVRNPRMTREGRVHVRHHAGIDIRPLYRDRQGRPLDSVLAVADGRVVYTNDTAGHSNYGRYVIVEHIWGGSPYYSLYAHLDEIWIDSGASVRRGEPLARLGYTGAGINRRRAHLHFEVNLLVNREFDSWYSIHYPKEKNHHGIYNGLNMVAVDAAKLFLALREEPATGLPDVVGSSEAFYSVTFQSSGPLDLVRRYPWLLVRQPTDGEDSWTITFSRDGLPLRVEPSSEEVKRPHVRMIDPSPLPYGLLTKGLVAGRRNNVSLSRAGERFLDLIAAARPPLKPAK